MYFEISEQKIFFRFLFFYNLNSTINKNILCYLPNRVKLSLIQICEMFHNMFWVHTLNLLQKCDMFQLKSIIIKYLNFFICRGKIFKLLINKFSLN